MVMRDRRVCFPLVTSPQCDRITYKDFNWFSKEGFMVEKGPDTGKPENQNMDTKPSLSSDNQQRKDLKGYLEELDKARNKLKTGEIGVEEAKRMLQEISEISANIKAEQEIKMTTQGSDTEKRVGKEAEKAARKQAKQDEKEAKKAREAEKRASKEVEKASRKQAKQDGREARRAEVAEETTESEVKQEVEEVKQAEETEEITEAEVKQEVEEVKQAEEIEEITEAKVIQEVEEAKRVQREEDSELIEGEVNLVLVPPINLGRMREFTQHLNQVQDLRLVLLHGSVDKGNIIVVSAGNPIPLVSILRIMSPVNQVNKIGDQIQVMLKEE